MPKFARAITRKTGGGVIARDCYDIKLVRMKEGKFYWEIPLVVDNANRGK